MGERGGEGALSVRATTNQDAAGPVSDRDLAATQFGARPDV